MQAKFSHLVLPIAAATSALLVSLPWVARAHEADSGYAAGAPGNPKEPARTVKVTMIERGKKMLFEPALVTVRRGEQIRFVLANDGVDNHEFVLATHAENRKHAEIMKKHPHMEHADPNAATVAPFNTGELLWRFTKRGEFEFACLVPGHFEAGMHGKIIVK